MFIIIKYDLVALNPCISRIELKIIKIIRLRLSHYEAKLMSADYKLL